MNKNKKHIKTGFTTPDKYFNNFDKKLLNKLSIEESESELPKEAGFTTPENYFDNVEGEILNKVIPTKTKVIKLFNKKQFLYATSIAAILALSFFILNPSNLNLSTFDDIEYAAFEEYLNTEDLNISALELADLYEIETNELDNISFLNIEDENILEYLSEETTSDDYYDSEL